MFVGVEFDLLEVGELVLILVVLVVLVFGFF